MDITNRFKENPIITPADLKPSVEGAIVECVLQSFIFLFFVIVFHAASFVSLSKSTVETILKLLANF